MNPLLQAAELIEEYVRSISIKTTTCPTCHWNKHNDMPAYRRKLSLGNIATKLRQFAAEDTKHESDDAISCG